MSRLVVLTMIFCACGALSARGQGNLLVSGDFEAPGGVVIPGWTLDEFATGTGDAINAAELATNAPIEGARDLWLRSFVGGQEPGPNNLANALLSQTAPATPGETYTFKGSSRWEANYSGGVTTLDAAGPLGAVESPTETTLEMAFLDAGGAAIGSPVVLDLRDEQTNFNFWVDHMLSGVAPTGTAQVRVTAAARDMVWNVGPTQSAFFDNFSLTGAAAPSTEILLNPGLEELPPSGLDAWTLVMDDPANPENDEIFRTAGFANNTAGGTTGVWISSFFGEPETPVSGQFFQTVPGTAGSTYELSAWSRFEANYAGGIASLPTETYIELAFLDAAEMVIGDPVSLELAAAGQTNDNMWRQFSVQGEAPAGTVSVRVSGILVDGVNSESNPQSAFFDDFRLTVVGGGQPGDFDGDGDVDGADFLVWQRGESPDPTSVGDLNTWQANFGSNASAAVAAVPEPASIGIALCMAAAVCGLRRRR